MFTISEIVTNSFGQRLQVVQPGSVVTGVRPIEAEGRDTDSVVFYPTAALKALPKVRTQFYIPVGETVSVQAPVEVEIWRNGSVSGIVSQERGTLLLTGIPGSTYFMIK